MSKLKYYEFENNFNLHTKHIMAFGVGYTYMEGAKLKMVARQKETRQKETRQFMNNNLHCKVSFVIKRYSQKD